MTKYALEVSWDDEVRLPKLVGPFDSQREAEGWATLNVVNGTWEVRRMGRPYYTRSRR